MKTRNNRGCWERQSQCPKGHPYTEQNTPQGANRFRCRICYAATRQAYRERNAARIRRENRERMRRLRKSRAIDAFHDDLDRIALSKWRPEWNPRPNAKI